MLMEFRCWPDARWYPRLRAGRVPGARPSGGIVLLSPCKHNVASDKIVPPDKFWRENCLSALTSRAQRERVPSSYRE